jgi:2-methylcitrate dehydratase PrpD
MKTYTKPYASCRYTHPSVEAAIRLRGKVRPGDVERIDIKTYSLAVSGHDHTEIPGSYSAKMSIPYATAAGLIYGKAGLQEFSEEKVRDPEILALTRKIRVEADQVLSDAFPGIQAASVSIHAADGRTLTERVDFPKGEPENPLTEKEFRERYNGLMAYAGQTAGEAVYGLVYGENAGIRDIMKNL